MKGMNHRKRHKFTTDFSVEQHRGKGVQHHYVITTNAKIGSDLQITVRPGQWLFEEHMGFGCSLNKALPLPLLLDFQPHAVCSR